MVVKENPDRKNNNKKKQKTKPILNFLVPGAWMINCNIQNLVVIDANIFLA